MNTTAPRRIVHPSPSIAAALSFLWPGLGQWYAGRPREAAIFAVPVIALFLVAIVWLAGGLDQAVIDLLIPGVALMFILLVIADGAWRLMSLLHASQLPRGRAAVRQPPTNAVVVTLGVLVLITHLWAVAVGWSLYQASGRLFAPVSIGPTPAPQATVGPSLLPSDGPPPSAPGSAEPSNRITVLLTGIDKSEIRSHSLTDTMIVVSVDPDTGETAMVSFPRDIARFPMSDGRLYSHKVNALMSDANQHRDKFPDGGLPTLSRELGYLLGISIPYYAAIDLDGFADLINEVGGVDIDNPRAINDPAYGGWTDGRVGFHLSAGRHHLDGQTALAYARSRRGAGDNDFTRARRQQQLLAALRAKLTDPTLLPKLPALIEAGSRVIQTNVPRDRLDQLLDVASAVEDDEGIRRVVLGPPYARNPPPGTPGGYQLILDMDRLAKLSVELFGTDSRYATAP
ncbi:MAG TPA: LCP family protein [Candidatus Limnocylindrales bacterium]|nr:LCP family protein [Candidatus Limnocylindrales bacterium]